MKPSRKKGKHPWKEKQREVRRKNGWARKLSGIKVSMKKITNRKMRRMPPIDRDGETQTPNKKIVDRWGFF
jgi:hypothetical protein